MTFKTKEEYRKHLEETLPEGAYQIGDSTFNTGERNVVAWTGKQGKIEYEVALWEEANKWLTAVDKELVKDVADYSDLTKEKIEEYLTDIFIVRVKKKP